MVDVASLYARSKDVELQQRCRELQALALDGNRRGELEAALPIDASLEDIAVDLDLAFLDGFVDAALANGARDYVPPEERGSIFDVGSGSGATGDLVSNGGGGGGGLRFTAYDNPVNDPNAHLVSEAPSLFGNPISGRVARRPVCMCLCVCV